MRASSHTNTLLVVVMMLAPLLVATPTVHAIEVTLESRLSSTTVPLDRELKLFVELSWQGSPELITPSIDHDFLLEGFEIIGSSSANMVQVSELDANLTMTRKRYTFTLKPTSRGKHTIGGVTVEYIDDRGETHTLRTNDLEVSVTEKTRPPLFSMETIRDNQLYFIAVLCLVVIIVAAIFIKRGYNKRKAKQADAEYHPKDELVSLIESKLKDRHLTNAAELYQQIYRLLRELLEKDYGISRNLSSGDARASIDDKGIPPKIADMLQEALSTCDQVRFSAAAPAEYETRTFIRQLLEVLKQ